MVIQINLLSLYSQLIPMTKYTIPELPTSWANGTVNGAVLYLGKMPVASVYFDACQPKSSTDVFRARLQMNGIDQLKKKHYITENEAKEACESALKYWVRHYLNADIISE